MVLEIWAHGTKNNSSNLSVNRKNFDLFYPKEEIIPSNNYDCQSNIQNLETSAVICNNTPKFARDADVSSVSHISSNGYYGYCGVVSNSTQSENLIVSNAMDFELCNTKNEFGRKRCFMDEIPIDNKRFKHEKDIYDNFRQTSFDPNATSIEFSNIIGNQHDNQDVKSNQMDLEMMQTNDSQMPMMNKTDENTNKIIHLKQNSFECSLKENLKSANKIIKSNEYRDISYTICKYNKNNNTKQINNTENLLENLFMLTHGGSNYQIWQHYNANIDI